MHDTRFDDCLEKVHAYVRAERLTAPRLVPQSWKDALAPKGDWRVCRGGQTDSICQGVAARADRNLLATLALSVLFERSDNPALRSLDIFECITLAPAIYAVTNLTDGARNWLRGKAKRPQDRARFQKFIRDLCVRDPSPPAHDRARLFLEDASYGCGMTWQNAKRVEAALRKRPDWTGVEVKILANRMEGRRPHRRANDPRMRCCQKEAEFVLPDQATLNRLGAIGEAAASRGPVIVQKDNASLAPARRPPDTREERKA